MAKNQMLKVLNPILTLLIITQALSGLLRDQLSYEAFEIVHEGGGIVLIVAIVLHVILNFSWVRSNFLPAKRT